MFSWGDRGGGGEHSSWIVNNYYDNLLFFCSVRVHLSLINYHILVLVYSVYLVTCRHPHQI